MAQDMKYAYDELSPEWHDTDKFLQLMIVDGCFILEILRVATTTTDASFSDDSPPPSQHQSSTPGDNPFISRDYAANDPIFSNHGMLYVVPYLKRDMVMLENQLPMLVLEKLVVVQKDESLKDCRDLVKCIMKFFEQYIPGPAKYPHEYNHCIHILDIYRKVFLLDELRCKIHLGRQHIEQENYNVIWCATELVAGGITIKKNKTRDLMDITFHYGGARADVTSDRGGRND